MLEGGFVTEVVLSRLDDEREARCDGLCRLCGLGLFRGGHFAYQASGLGVIVLGVRPRVRCDGGSRTLGFGICLAVIAHYILEFRAPFFCPLSVLVVRYSSSTVVLR